MLAGCQLLLLMRCTAAQQMLESGLDFVPCKRHDVHLRLLQHLLQVVAAERRLRSQRCTGVEECWQCWHPADARVVRS